MNDDDLIHIVYDVVRMLQSDGLAGHLRLVWLLVAWCPAQRLVDIAKQSNTTVSSASRICRELEEKGLITIRQDPNSLRDKRVFLTTAGKRLRSKCAALIRAGVAGWLAPNHKP